MSHVSDEYQAWFAAHEWVYDYDSPVDPALFAWRVRWFDSTNNPFGVA